ncbi:MAG: VWA domain-containing protein, partial [Rhodoferax sp.]|nr:VWA domain-containing protein [Rhodoferax sp.]
MKNEAATLRTSAGTPLVLHAVQASGRLSGLLLQMTLRQRFRNDETVHIEVSYSFPLPWGAVLTGLEVTLGSRHLRGQVLGRRQASAQYE